MEDGGANERKEDNMKEKAAGNKKRKTEILIDSMESDVSYRCIGETFDEGVTACGFMRKRTKSRSQIDFCIGYYSGFFLLGGNGVYVTDKGTEIPLHAGDFVQRLPGETHSTYVEPDGEWLEFFISFGKKRYETLKALGLLPKEYVSRRPVREKAPECAAHLERLKKAADGELGIVLAEQERFLLELLRYGRQTAGREESRTADELQAAENGMTADERYAGKIRQAADLLSADPGVNLNMEEVAGQLAMGYETFRKQFRRQMGVSPADYRLQHKMRQACHILDSGISIKETAALMGYADVYTFTRQFTKTIGSAPGAYRKKHGEYSR